MKPTEIASPSLWNTLPASRFERWGVEGVVQAMRYYFHTTYAGPRVSDETGVDLPDQQAAWIEATKTCGQMIRDLDGSLLPGAQWVMEVDDESGKVFSFHFGAARRG